jgi:hypothetical protein
VNKTPNAAPAPDDGMVLVPREIVANYANSTHIPRHRRICEAALTAPTSAATPEMVPLEDALRQAYEPREYADAFPKDSAATPGGQYEVEVWREGKMHIEYRTRQPVDFGLRNDYASE